MIKRFTFLLIVCSVVLLSVGFSITEVNAQFQDDTFSGSDANSYTCFEEQDGNGEPGNGVSLEDGIFVCPDGSQARLIPPKLSQLQIWFVRAVYVIWALTATLSFFFLIGLGFQYMLTRGDITKITEIRKKILYYLLGFALVFLAVPILNTLFDVIGINEEEECYDIFENESLGFQFFFSDLCTADPGIDEITGGGGGSTLPNQ